MKGGEESYGRPKKLWKKLWKTKKAEKAAIWPKKLWQLKKLWTSTSEQGTLKTSSLEFDLL